MAVEPSRQSQSRQIEPALFALASEGQFANLEDWPEARPLPRWDDLWDAFERIDEIDEPQPEHGDFWGQPDELEPI